MGTNGNYAVCVENLVKVFDRYTAVDSVSFCLERGTVVGLLGTNGAGKTTIVKILSTMLRPTGGKASIDGIDVTVEPIAVRRRIGYLPETPTLYEHLTCREFLRFIGELRNVQNVDGRVEDLIKGFGLKEHSDALIGTYSKGLKQRTAFAQAIIHEPNILLLDEPILGLDPRYTKFVKGYIREFSAKGGCALITTHLTELAETLCDRFLIIHRGKIRADGGLNAVLSDTGTQTLEEAFIRLTE